MEFETVLEQTIALVQRQGKRNEARQLLAEVYDWFTEGLDPADLQEAKALLEELAGHAKRGGGKW
jgi:predicted ATPase